MTLSAAISWLQCQNRDPRRRAPIDVRHRPEFLPSGLRPSRFDYPRPATGPGAAAVAPSRRSRSDGDGGDHSRAAGLGGTVDLGLTVESLLMTDETYAFGANAVDMKIATAIPPLRPER